MLLRNKVVRLLDPTYPAALLYYYNLESFTLTERARSIHIYMDAPQYDHRDTYSAAASSFPRTEYLWLPATPSTVS